MVSDEAEDLNEDGELDEADYELFVELYFDEDIYVPSFDEWLASDEAEDLNEDGELDEEDYELFVENLSADSAENFPEGPILLDFNANSGDQGQRLIKGAAVGKTATVQLNAADLEQAINGWNATISYDPSKLRCSTGSFQASSFIPGFIGLEDLSKSTDGVVNVGGTVLGSNGSGEGSGTLGKVSFTVADGFDGEAELQIVAVNLRPVDGEQIKLEVSHTVTISKGLIGDANDDGITDFNDFFLFADAFGSSDPIFDYDGSGIVDFDDFYIFADAFSEEYEPS